MTREIKFRAWDVDKKLFVNLEEKHKEKYFVDLSNGQLEIGYFLNDGDYQGLEIQQYTGLKDKNGKEIYEGDIIKGTDRWTYSDSSFVFYKVEWESPVNNPNDYPNIIHGYCLEDSKQMEIVGNVYENPKLLQNK
jgi:uncharacterized phage protein (TIGR01671 family)